MSKPVKQMIIDLYRDTFADVTDAVLIDIRGITAIENNALRSDLAKKQGVRITVVKNSLARKAFEGHALQPATDLLDGPSAVVYGGESVVNVARELIEWSKKLEKLQFKGAIMEGVIFGPDQVAALSKYPTRQEAQAQVIQVILGPAGQVIGAVASAGANIAGILKTLEEKLEKGAAVETVAAAG